MDRTLSEALIADYGLQSIPCLPCSFRHRPCAIFDIVVGMGQLFRLLVTSHPCLVRLLDELGLCIVERSARPRPYRVTDILF